MEVIMLCEISVFNTLGYLKLGFLDECTELSSSFKLNIFLDIFEMLSI